MTNRGFVELHNPTGFYLVGLGFLLVTLIIVAGGIFAKMIEREQVERRRQMGEAQFAASAEAAVDLSRVAPDPEPESNEHPVLEAGVDAKPKRRPKKKPAKGPESTGEESDHPSEPA